jgi:hypothetical protein
MTFVTALDDRDNDTTTPLHMKPISSSIPLSQDHYTSHFNSAGSYSDISSMKAACPPTTRTFDHMSASLPSVNITTLLDENVHLKETLVDQLDLIQQQSAMDKKQFLEEIFTLKSRITRLEDRALEQHDGPTGPAEETLLTPTSLQRFFLPPPRQDPNKIMVECSIPKLVVDILMVRAKQQDTIMSCLRSICYPAKIWIPCRESHNRSPSRRFLFLGWTKQVVMTLGRTFPVSTLSCVNKMSGRLGTDLHHQ